MRSARGLYFVAGTALFFFCVYTVQVNSLTDKNVDKEIDGTESNHSSLNNKSSNGLVPVFPVKFIAAVEDV